MGRQARRHQLGLGWQTDTAPVIALPFAHAAATELGEQAGHVDAGHGALHRLIQVALDVQRCRSAYAALDYGAMSQFLTNVQPTRHRHASALCG
ncbi:hypothetical protein D3C72_2333970 [compost metagenome]